MCKKKTLLSFDADSGRLYSPDMEIDFADRPYHYSLSGYLEGGEKFIDSGLTEKSCRKVGREILIRASFEKSKIQFSQVFLQAGRHLKETISFKNASTRAVNLNVIEIGLVSSITHRAGWRLCAIPFRIQLDGSLHDYSTEDLVNGSFRNAVYSEKTRQEPPLTEKGCLRSESWCWWNGKQGLVIIKYNTGAIELSVACPEKRGDEWTLRFGGVGFCLYGEPQHASSIAPGEEIVFGETIYVPFEGGLSDAFSCYREFLDSKGHRFPEDYNPPVNWNELYDVGWHHSDAEKLKKYYTRDTLFKEAKKAKDCGCELLYLDPGWEVGEGTTLWDESRLGTVAELVKILKEKYGLGLGYRTILRSYTDHWEHRYMVKHADREKAPLDLPEHKLQLWEMCLCNPEFWQEKLRRILEITRRGIRFMMFDEMDWRGPCYDSAHGHRVPTTLLDHIHAVYKLSREVRRQCPGLIIEVHDPVWPWFNCIYVPTYFEQGFGNKGSYDENWGFEYMWDCINDLKSGKALALYYYNLACNMPLYLHINMSADNDNSLFFWWAASTVRHLGIGGKECHKSVAPPGGLPSDPEKRFAAYKEQMRIYKQFKQYFVRGTFHGLAENIHLHTLPEENGGIVNVFNLTESEEDFKFFIPGELLLRAEFKSPYTVDRARRKGSLLSVSGAMAVKGAQAQWKENGVELRLNLPPLCPGLVYIGEPATNSQVQ